MEIFDLMPGSAGEASPNIGQREPSMRLLPPPPLAEQPFGGPAAAGKPKAKEIYDDWRHQ